MKKIKVGVLMGGPSAEREISLLTGRAICDNLNKKKYEVLPIEMTKQGKLLLDKKYYAQLNQSGSKTKKSASGKKLISLDSQLKSKTIDIMFIALHGPYGEDGRVQGMLEILGIPYTGSGVLSSALAMNKAKTAEIYQQHGLLVPEYLDFTRRQWKEKNREILKTIRSKFAFPLVVKPVDQGSSVGTYLVKQAKDLADRVEDSFRYSDWVMVQKYIQGREATCGVMEEQGRPFATPVTEIIAKAGDFYDLASKYDEGGSEHICPAKFDRTITRKIQAIALKAHEILGCRGMSRTDVFVTKNKKIYVIETNTIPGMTATSLLPEAARAMGIDFTKMLDLIIKSSL